MGLTGLCPGTFDPVTNGHLDIIERASRHFDRLVVGVLQNPSKAPLFSVEERVSLLKEVTGPLEGVEVGSFSGLLVDYAKQQDASVIVKGLRAITDFENELQMAQMNHRLGGVETFFITTNPIWSYLSSSLVKEIARLGGDIEGLVPPWARKERLVDGSRKSVRKVGEVDLASRIQQLEDMVKEAKSMPLSSSALLQPRGSRSSSSRRSREQLPEEVKQARWVVRDREVAAAKGAGVREHGRTRARRADAARRAGGRGRCRTGGGRARRPDAHDRPAPVSDGGGGLRRRGSLAQFEIAIQRLQEDARADARDAHGERDQGREAHLVDQLQQTQGSLIRVAEQVDQGRTSSPGAASRAGARAGRGDRVHRDEHAHEPKHEPLEEEPAQ